MTQDARFAQYQRLERSKAGVCCAEPSGLRTPKGRHTTAQGNTLGTGFPFRLEALKGCNNSTYGMLVSPFQGLSAFSSLSQGVALGCLVPPLHGPRRAAHKTPPWDSRLSSFFAILARVMLLFFCAATTHAATLDAKEAEALLMEATQYFDQANQAVSTNPAGAKDLYGKSILRFERLVHEGGIENGQLFYNLGNAYLLTGDLGRAILNYRRAAFLIPNDPNLRQNLEYARSQCRDRIEEPQRKVVLKTLFFWHYDLPVSVRLALFVTCNALLWGAAAARLFFRKRSLRRTIVACAALTLLLGGSVLTDTIVQARDRAGVLLQDEVVARKGNGENYGPSFQEPLHAGTEFNLIESRGDWYYARLFDGRQCWVPAQAAELVHPENAG